MDNISDLCSTSRKCGINVSSINQFYHLSWRTCLATMSKSVVTAQQIGRLAQIFFSSHHFYKKAMTSHIKHYYKIVTVQQPLAIDNVYMTSVACTFQVDRRGEAHLQKFTRIDKLLVPRQFCLQAAVISVNIVRRVVEIHSLIQVTIQFFVTIVIEVLAMNLNHFFNVIRHRGEPSTFVNCDAQCCKKII